VVNQGRFQWWSAICSIAGFVLSTIGWFLRILRPPPGGFALPGMPPIQRLQVILFLGVAAAAFHGILWLLSERLFHWKFHAGGGALPQGWSAVALSLTMTIPLVVVPPLYSRMAHVTIVQLGHPVAACFVIIVAAVGHVFLYGANLIEFKGIRNVVMPLSAVPSRGRAFGMECIYAATHFSSIALVYRVIVQSRVGPLSASMTVPVVISAMVWLSAVSVFIFVRYPDSVSDKSGIEVRGILNALTLTITLQAAMLM
jgi:hypothetical protein